MSARRWDTDAMDGRVNDALERLEESRVLENKTTKVRGYAVTSFDGGIVCIAVVMSDGDIEKIMLQTPTAPLQ